MTTASAGRDCELSLRLRRLVLKLSVEGRALSDSLSASATGMLKPGSLLESWFKGKPDLWPPSAAAQA